jgi:4'-phosphopantetheinyl transferase
MGDVHVWQADLDALPDFENCLAPDELARADRFRTAQLRQRFVGGRGVLRDVLSRYLAVGGSSIRFKYGAAGKPLLASTSRLRFNLSHCGPLALLALTLDAEIGIDVEQIRALPELEQIADRLFAPNESRALAALPPEQREPGFFVCWTRKEAIVKCLGEGLSHPLDSFEVTLAPEEPCRILSAVNADLRSWWLANLEPAPGFAAAVATEAPAARVTTFAWQASSVAGHDAADRG